MACLVTTKELRSLCEECGLSVAEGKNLIGLWQEKTGALMDEYPSKKQLEQFKSVIRSGIDTSPETIQTPESYASKELAENVSSELTNEIQQRQSQQASDISNRMDNLSKGFISDNTKEQINDLGAQLGTLQGDYGEAAIANSQKEDIEKAVYQKMSDSNVTQDVMNKAWQTREENKKSTPTKANKLDTIFGDLIDNFENEIERAYKPFTNFFRSNRLVNSWLSEMQNREIRKNITQKPLDSFISKRPNQLTRDEALSTAVNAYFSASDINGISYAWYPIPGTSKFIRFRRYRNGEQRTDLGVPRSFKDIITRKLFDVVITEHNRIQDIRNRNTSFNRESIPVFDAHGDSFLYLPMLNNYISSSSGNNVVTEITNLLSNNRLTEYKDFVDNAVDWAMRMEFNSFYNRARETRSLDKYSMDELEEYYWNSKLANINMLQILSGDIAFFDSKDSLYDYLAFLDREGTVLNTDAEFGDHVASGFELTRIVGSASSHIAYRSMESYRDLMIMSNQWTDAMEEAYKDYQAGKLSPSDHRIIFKPLKTSVRSFVPVSDGMSGSIKAPIAIDNIEYPVFLGKEISPLIEATEELMEISGTDVIRSTPTDHIGMPSGTFTISSLDIIIQDTDIEDSVIDSTLREKDKFYEFFDNQDSTQEPRFSKNYSDTTSLLDDEASLSIALKNDAIEHSQSDILALPYSDPVSSSKMQESVMRILDKIFSDKNVPGAKMLVVSGTTSESQLKRIYTKYGYAYEALVPPSSNKQIAKNSFAVGYATTAAGTRLAIPIYIKDFLPVSHGSRIVLPDIEQLSNVSEMNVYFATDGDFMDAFKSASTQNMTPSYKTILDAASFISNIRPEQINDIASINDSLTYQKKKQERESVVKSIVQHDISSKVTPDLSLSVTLMGKTVKDLYSYVGHYVDALNEPGVANTLNITPITSDTAMMLARLGYSPRQIGIFLNQPIIRDITNAYFNYGSPRDIEHIIDKSISNYLSKSGKQGLNLVSTDFDMSEDDYLKVLMSTGNLTENDYFNQALIGRKFKQMRQEANDIGLIAEADAAPKIASSVLEQLSNDAAQSIKQQIAWDSNIYSESLYWNQDEYIEKRNELDGKLEKLFPQYGGNVLGIVSSIFSRSAYDGRVTNEMIDDVINEMAAYVLSVGKDGYDVYSGTKAQLKDFPSRLQDIMENNPELADNALLKAISVKGGIYRPYLSVAKNIDEDKLTSAWNSLLYSSPIGAKLAKDLFNYSIRQGFRKGSLASLAPASVRAAIPAYTDGLNALSRIAVGSSQDYEGIPEVLRQFEIQYMLNHLDEVSSPVDSSHTSLFVQNGTFLPEVQLDITSSYDSSFRDIIRSHDTILDTSTNITYERNNLYDFLKVTNGRETAYYRHDENGSYYMTRSLGGHVLEYMPGFDASAIESMTKEYVAPAKEYDIDPVQAIRMTEPRMNNTETFNQEYARLTSPFSEETRSDSELSNYEDNDNFLDADGKPICR